MSDSDHRHGPASEGRLPDPDEAEDSGAYIGRMPERSTETIPGGLSPADERVSAVATQSSGGGADERPSALSGDETPEGHRTGERANDDRRREAGDRD
jgi:hypothetical protein